MCILTIDRNAIMCYNDYSKEKELTTMKNNAYRKTNNGKYTYKTKKTLHKETRKANKKIDF